MLGSAWVGLFKKEMSLEDFKEKIAAGALTGILFFILVLYTDFLNDLLLLYFHIFKKAYFWVTVGYFLFLTVAKKYLIPLYLGFKASRQ